MKILVIGPSTTAHYMAKALAMPNNIVYHFGANKANIETNNYIPLSNPDSELFTILDTIKFDLILPLNIKYFLKFDVQNTIKKLNVPYLMPSQENATLEWSKIKTKEMLFKLGIPTPDYKIITRKQLKDVFFDISRPFVIKYEQTSARGLQTSVITDNNYQKEYNLLDGHNDEVSFSNLVIIEEYINGHELSYHALCNNINWVYFGSARDYKRMYNNDDGPNTDGMGSYNVENPYPEIDGYVEKIIRYLKQQNDAYVGFLYLGIIIDKNGLPIVLEINVRPGCPEIQTILPSINNDLTDIFYKAATNSKIDNIMFNNKKSVSVSVIPKPNSDIKLKVINLPKDITYSVNYNNNFLVFSASSNTITDSRDTIYNYLKTLNLSQDIYRTDIAST